MTKKAKICQREDEDLSTRMRAKELKRLESEINERHRFVVKKMLDPFLIPEFEIIINDSLGFTR